MEQPTTLPTPEEILASAPPDRLYTTGCVLYGLSPSAWASYRFWVENHKQRVERIENTHERDR